MATRVPEDKLLKGSGKVTRFDFDRYDERAGRMAPYGKGFLHRDEAKCYNAACREKSHSVFFTWKEVVRGGFVPEIGTRVNYVALPPSKEDQAPRAISLRVEKVERERPSKMADPDLRYSR